MVMPYNKLFTNWVTQSVFGNTAFTFLQGHRQNGPYKKMGLRISLCHGGSKHWQRTFEISYRTAMHGNSRVLSAISVHDN